ncbi:MAG: bifunctional oligoribonuclease/PAP phosphatase NrnA [Firmicutes bacterium]|nr:bifunctional oligoribonuclease/PAP phosphatase NrnA [Bacillota bacterium]
MSKFKLPFELDQYQNIYVFTHIRPDGDALGSTLALRGALKLLDKSVEIFCADEIPARYSFLPGIEHFRDSVSTAEKRGLAFVLDCNDLYRLGSLKEVASKFDKIVNIDHHVTNNFFGDLNFVDTAASSTGEIIFQFIQDNNLELNKEISLNLYVAIVSDTGSFKFGNTTPLTMYVAGELLKKGVNPSLVGRKLFDEYPLSTLLLLRDCLSEVQFDSTKKIIWTNVYEETLAKNKAKQAELDGFINYLINVQEAKVGVLFFHTGQDKTKIGFRSKSIDVASLAQSLGGGGHPRAAGVTIPGKPEVVVRDVLQIIGERLEKDDS